MSSTGYAKPRNKSREKADRSERKAATPPVRSRRWQDSARPVLAAGLGSIGISILIVTVGMWYRFGGVTTIHNTADVLTTLGRLTGLLATDSLLLQLLLMARLPFVELAAGWARTSGWHKLNGKICLGLVLLHVGLVTVGYAGTAKVSIPSEAVTMVQRLNGMPAAVISTVAMILVVATSLFIVRRRLRYETWHLVHLLAYASVLLAWFHQIPTSTIFINNPAASWFWTALYLGTLELVLLFRVAHPIVRALWHDMRVVEVHQESEDVVSLLIGGRNLEYLNATSGQFLIWRFLAPGFWTEAHPFSLSSAPTGASFRITVKNVGDFTSKLGRLPVGTRVVTEGPFGSFTEGARSRPGVAMIAGGIGITPIRSLLEEIQGKVVVIYRVIKEEEAVLRHELDELAAKRGAVIHYVVGDHRDPKNRNLLSEQHLRSLVPDLWRRDVYLCGPPPMMQAVEATIRRIGVPGRRIHKDTFSL